MAGRRKPKEQPYDASDPEQIAKAKEQEEHLLIGLDGVLNDELGRAWLYDLIYRVAHVSQPSGPGLATEYNEGARSVGQAILEQVRARSPKAFLLMHSENHFDEAV